MNSGAPARGFSDSEFEQRCARVQALMYMCQLDLVLLTTEPHIRYYTGFLTQFWQSPTRPWFLLLPLEGKPIAVIPGIGAEGMRQTWIDDIRCWSSPDPVDDGISLLTSSIESLPRRFGRLGLPLGNESHLRMPINDFRHLQHELKAYDFVDCALMLHQQCCIKSAEEVAKIAYVCELAADSFNALPEYANAGQSERDLVRSMRIDLLRRGADHSPYIVSASGADGYGDIIMGPQDRIPANGDILTIDTGTVYDGYYCDFDRNYAIRHASDKAQQVYQTLYQSTEAGLRTARPGVTTAEVWQAMWRVLQQGGAEANEVGRMGHGLGAQLTEWPSISANNPVRLESGMVITLEPGMSYAGGKMMVHEENILITDSGPRLLSKRAAEELLTIV